MNAPAFPANHFDLADGEHGMTLRDYFAAKAVQGEVALYGICSLPDAAEEIARRAYVIADAMLKEREK